MKVQSLSVPVSILLLTLASSPAHPQDFWTHWGDGKAELNGYTLKQPRYGALRDGKAVLIFVTEDFSDTLRVKADPGRHPASDVYPVLKLNAVRPEARLQIWCARSGHGQNRPLILRAPPRLGCALGCLWQASGA